ncbi:MAG: methyltransferase domain-containing protein [Streptosporangiales bacterium]|nr:methyltransferase domain-containing protein [Streptosporangiales bacterium]
MTGPSERVAVPPNVGSGPGPVTPDGCAVEFYALMPAGREPGVVHAAVPDGASILELGAGAGRLTRSLVALGHDVVAVDESAEMLERIDGAEAVHSRIEDLDLPPCFDAALLASHLINAPHRETRRAFLRTCRRHIRDDGCVVIERHAPDWFDTAHPVTTTWEGIVVRLREVRRPAPGLLFCTIDYGAGGSWWTHSFTNARVDDAELAELLAWAGLRLDTFLTEDRGWIRAVPDGPSPFDTR